MAKLLDGDGLKTALKVTKEYIDTNKGDDTDSYPVGIDTDKGTETVYGQINQLLADSNSNTETETETVFSVNAEPLIVDTFDSFMVIQNTGWTVTLSIPAANIVSRLDGKLSIKDIILCFYNSATYGSEYKAVTQTISNLTPISSFYYWTNYVNDVLNHKAEFSISNDDDYVYLKCKGLEKYFSSYQNEQLMFTGRRDDHAMNMIVSIVKDGVIVMQADTRVQVNKQ